MADKSATQEIQQEADTEDQTHAGADAADAGGEQAQPSEAETRAQRMGWRPKAEYEASGRDPAKWVDADEFVRRGEESLPVLRERLRKQDKIIASQESKMEEGNKLLRELVTHQQEQTRAAVENAVKSLKAERREAASTGDVDKVEELSSEIAEAEASLKTAPAPAKVDERATIPQEVVDWAEANPWFNTDPVMNAVAVAAYGKLVPDKTMTETQKLAKVKAEVIRRFPENFSNARRTEPPAVEGGGNGQRRSGAKGWNDIPADDRAIAQRLIKQGAVKDQATYSKLYWQQEQAAG